MRGISLFVAGLVCGATLAASMPASAADTGAEEANGPRVYFVNLKDGDTVPRTFKVQFGVEGIAIKPAGDMSAHSGHHHLFIDESEWPPAKEAIPADDHHRHYGAGQTEDTLTLEPGPHLLQLVFADGRHVQFDPPIVSQAITIDVK
ncbi:MAG: DUF4399 domain-containing protein [Xanthomonadales bacterium]|nr:DUF4399 domain-containing protein [Xanthomonadales bacterium]MDL1868680.1 DUF4399 domain-containing protein [Gammaproteobacteria bacterium PRO6]